MKYYPIVIYCDKELHDYIMAQAKSAEVSAGKFVLAKSNLKREFKQLNQLIAESNTSPTMLEQPRTNTIRLT